MLKYVGSDYIAVAVLVRFLYNVIFYCNTIKKKISTTF